MVERHTVDGRRAWVASLAVASGLAVALRAPMLTQPMTADEGGYAGVARGWAHGATLYRDVWVDRPQGLLVLYRFTDWLDGGHAIGIRVLAMVFGVVLVLATAWAVRDLAGAAAGGTAAIVCATLTGVPVLEGFAANGELLAGTFAALAVALAARAMRAGQWWRWLAVGVAGGVAVSLKQSGFDGLFAVCTWLVVVVAVGPARRRAAARLGWVVGGALIPFVLMAVHAAIIGWDRWVQAVGGYRLRVQSAVSAAVWQNLVDTARVAGPVLGLAGAAALAGIVVAPRMVREHAPPSAPRAWIVLVAWLVGAVLAFLAGGGFWRHYWVQLGAPVSALAGIAVAGLAARWRSVAVALLVVPALVATVWVLAGPQDQWILRATDDWRSPRDARVAAWLRANDAGGHDVYVLCASAGLYGDSDIVPGYPYLWMVEVHDAPGARARLVAYLTDPGRAPRFIAAFQTAQECDDSGAVQRLLDTTYQRVATVDFVDIYERR